MEKDKKYNVVLGLMIFFFILFVAVCVAWGLGFISINNVGSKIDNSDSVGIDNTSEQEQKADFEEVEEMTEELAYGILNKYKSENLSDANWYITNVTLVAHGDNNSYWVSYDAINYSAETPYEDGAATIIEYKEGEWTTSLPGSTGWSEELISKYNFVKY